MSLKRCFTWALGGALGCALPLPAFAEDKPEDGSVETTLSYNRAGHLELAIRGGSVLFSEFGERGQGMKLVATPYASFYASAYRLGYWATDNIRLHGSLTRVGGGISRSDTSSLDFSDRDGLGLFVLGSTAFYGNQAAWANFYIGGEAGTFYYIRPENDNQFIPFVAPIIGGRHNFSNRLSIELSVSPKFLLSENEDEEYVLESAVGVSYVL